MSANERAAAKKWLRDLRAARGYTQVELAELVGVDRRTILNAEDQNQGFPNGWTMLLVLRELGVVADAPADPVSPVVVLLGSLEEQVAAGFEKTTRAIARLANHIDRLAPPAPPQAGSGSG